MEIFHIKRKLGKNIITMTSNVNGDI